jgi:superfamily I DNA/RNA helicase
MDPMASEKTKSQKYVLKMYRCTMEMKTNTIRMLLFSIFLLCWSGNIYSAKPQKVPDIRLALLYEMKTGKVFFLEKEEIKILKKILTKVRERKVDPGIERIIHFPLRYAFSFCSYIKEVHALDVDDISITQKFTITKYIYDDDTRKTMKNLIKRILNRNSKNRRLGQSTLKNKKSR